MAQNSLLAMARSKWRGWSARVAPPRLSLDEMPPTPEILSADQLARHAVAVAAGHVLDPSPVGPNRFLHRLKENALAIAQTHALIAAAVADGQRIAPAAEWLLDNYYLIEEHIQLARRHLPKGYSRQLPRLRQGPFKGLPRVYAIAMELITHSDGRVDPDNLNRFVTSYQMTTTLGLGELWAVPIMLRLGLIDNLRVATERTAARRKDQDAAEKWAARFIELSKTKPKAMVVALGDLVRSNPPMTRPFLATLATRLQGQHASLGLVLQWAEQELADRGQTIEQLLQIESQDQSGDRATVGNSITGLRTLDTIDWRNFVESQSITEAWLRRDPLGIYAGMDFHTRDRYRHVVEAIAKRSEVPEVEIAKEAILLSKTSRSQPGADPLESHVGYYLVDRGRPVLEAKVGYAPSLSERLGRMSTLAYGLLYAAGAAAVTLLLTWVVLASVSGPAPAWSLVVLSVLAVFVAAQPALLVVNWIVTLLVRPVALPRLDFEAGVPDEFRTVVAVPGMLASPSVAGDLADEMEVRYLANRDRNLLFVLLTDFTDAPAQAVPGDEDLVAVVKEKFDGLNRKYANGDGDRFFLLHRPRLWNPSEGVWMGYERKRGKLEQFNALLMTGESKAFSHTVGDAARLRGVRYVITLDADTKLPPQASWKMVGAMAHPLNRPVVDVETRRVIRGHGILQPRVSIALSGAERSRYSRLFSADAGIDPYTREVSDVYHDLFSQASFIGKGIYDVAAVEACLGGRFPDNTILSHDLIEGCYARCGFVSDVELMEDSPARYTADMDRRHRWVRGDWQIMSWLMRRVPTGDGGREANPLGGLSRWKIFDNLRRSLAPAAVLALWLHAWLFVPGANGVVLAILYLLVLPRVARGFSAVFAKPPDASWHAHLAWTLHKQWAPLAQFALSVLFLPYEAVVYIDAVARVMWRRYVSGKHLLEWRVSALAENSARTDLPGLYRAMWSGVAIGAAAIVGVLLWNPGVWFTALPLAVAWVASPIAAWWLSRPRTIKHLEFSGERLVFVGRLARRTWRFFEVYAGPRTNWLAPDNMQEVPHERLAERTSPTNIGLGLLANLTAYDMGYIGLADLTERTEKAFATMLELERYRGHFLNWYDTQTCKALPGRYVSMVDSGNLAGFLNTLTRGLDELQGTPILPPRWLGGLTDTAHVLHEEVLRAKDQKPSTEAAKQLAAAEEALDQFLTAAAVLPPTRYARQALLDRLIAVTAGLRASVTAADAEVRWWAEALHKTAAGLVEQLAYFLPWPAATEAQLQLLGQVLVELNTDAAEAAALLELLRRVPRLDELAEFHERFGPALESARRDLARSKVANADSLAQWLGRVCEGLDRVGERAARQTDALLALRQRCDELAQMDFGFLYDPQRKLFSIGYQIDHRRLDPNHYDLLASEARLGSYVAVARAQVPVEHWFMLNRMLTPVDGGTTLVSWSGSMFEYLMPLLVMPDYPGTLLDIACGAAVDAQIEYGRASHVPWGISESCCALVDAQSTYQYRPFGVPALGLKRGLGADLVVAPYATAMALMVRPKEAYDNLRRMADDGWIGAYGLYEAIDYTPARLPTGQKNVVIRTFMSHHSGMTLLSLARVMLGGPMQRRFMADPEFRANQLLLHERVPAPGLTSAIRAPGSDIATSPADQGVPMRVFTSPHTPAPAVGLLSNGRYHVMLSNAGGGSSRWHDTSLTRWREDATKDDWGFFCYLRDADTGRTWATTYQPTARTAEKYEAIFVQGRVEYRVIDDNIEAYTRVSVSPEDDVEVRHVTLTNLGDRPRSIEVTSYGEVVLTTAAADTAHRVFSNLLVETHVMQKESAILCTRRPRAADEVSPWMFHALVSSGPASDPATGATAASFETDRGRFIGRGRTVRNPRAMEVRGPLAGVHGPALDPIVAIRRTFKLKPGESVEINLVLGIAPTREAATGLLEKYRDRQLALRVFETAWTHSQVLMEHLGATEVDAQLFNRLAGSLIFAGSALRASPALVAQNRRGQSALWGQSISGDLPIVLMLLAGSEHMDVVRHLLQAHAYWRHRGVRTDLMILVEDHEGYRQGLFDQVVGLVTASTEGGLIDKPGGVFIRNAEQVSEADRMLMQSVARIVLSDRGGTLAEQSRRFVHSELAPKVLRPSAPSRARADEGTDLLLERDLKYFNGTGGFTADGREYVILLDRGRTTPAPWSNVLANGLFGTVVSESGGAYTWFENAHEFRLTPWQNDPVTDACGEALYIRDEATGRFWSPTPLPARGATPYVTRHGLGYSAFEHEECGVRSELFIYVAVDAPVKFLALTLRNTTDAPMRLSVTGYWEWTLGEMRSKTAMHVVTRLHGRTGAIFASSAYNPEFANHVAFVHSSLADRTFTADRAEFLGRNGSMASPAAMRYQRLSNRTGATFDPCAALHAPIELAPGEERQVVFMIGAGRSEQEVEGLLDRFRGVAGARQALEEVWALWQRMLRGMNVQTPDPAINFLANLWLPYQVIACRIWGRSGYYQSGGAFGFRDQLQDTMAVMHPCPWLLRDQILGSASRQFREGDVQHWWHPPTGRGVRTTCSDDYLWLPYAAARYVLGTGDTGVLDQKVPFLEARQLRPGEESFYDLPSAAGEQASLYEHCVRAINHGLRVGPHGLPLMGGGDWNDGMNRVGKEGRGESVWLAFFLCRILDEFARVAALRNDQAMVEHCRQAGATMRENIEKHAWDGHWYKRAFFDDGAALGSEESDECKIDSLPQSWAVISGVGNPHRAKEAMQAVDERLVRRDLQLIQLFDPPFDHSKLDPGYIKGYQPGVRENGGQYTHAAVWVAIARGEMHDAEKLWEYLTLLNPIHHAATPQQVVKYQVEPYVVAADIYTTPSHAGQGGWTWYTGSAGWMYRLITESLLGVKVQGDRLSLAPVLPTGWTSYSVSYRFHDTPYEISVKVVGPETWVTRKMTVDGVEQADGVVHLVNDEATHRVAVEVG
ncbi:MAG: cyclic beta 1-2 glucan synthetase [Planctomycetes bacterium]|nr:cyclic beta 1-2 glucan synthetase [Planctomycetota bacterium]